jgi:hypothetical protein
MNRNEAHFYPMKQRWQFVNQLIGFWSWFCIFSAIVGSFFLLLLLFEWTRKVFPAFLRIVAGGPGSYLRLSKEGLEYRNWPFNEIHCSWESVQRIHNSRWFGSSLHLQRAEEIGFPEFSVNLSPQQIHLNGLVGWSDGSLENDLRQFAPHLFSARH